MLAAGKFVPSMASSRSLHRLLSPAASSIMLLFSTQDSDGSPEALPRRFVPQLAEGFDEDADDGLRDFDRIAPRLLHHAAAAALVIAAISSMATLTFLLMAR